MTITIMIVDDHSIVTEGIQVLLSLERDMHVIGSAADGRQALKLAKKHKPHIVLMDISMPSLNGIEALQQMHEASPDTRVLILSMHANRSYILRAINAGAYGYVLKESAGTELIDAIHAAVAGRTYFSQSVRDLYERRSTDFSNPLETLSNREREVLQLTVEGKTGAEIAEILYLSPKSVETYRSRLMRKLNLNNLPELVKFAIQHGLTPLE